MKYPLVIAALFWVIGLYLGSTKLIDLKLIVIGILAGVSLFIISLFTFKRKSKLWILWLAISILLLAFLRMGWYQIEHQSQFNEELVKQIGKKEIGIRGYIETKPNIDGNIVKFTILPISYQWEGKEYGLATKEKLLVYLFLKKKDELLQLHDWQQGMGIRLYGEITKPLSANNPGVFNYQQYLERQAIYWKFNIYDISNVQLSAGRNIWSLLDGVKTNASAGIDRLFSEPYAGFVKAIILGDRQDLSQELKDNFSILGISHLLAISGLHLSVLSAILLWILTKIGLTKQKAVYLLSLALVGYMLLTGASASVVRATIMTILVLNGLNFNRSFSSLQALSLAVIGMTMYKPMWIFDIGFQLSFVITFFILWGLSQPDELFFLKNSFFKKALFILIITQTASLPLVFYYFHQYSVLAILSNLIIVPIFSMLILPAAIMILLLNALNLYIAVLFAEVLTYLLEFLFSLLNLSAKISLFHLYGSVSSFLLVFIIYIFLAWIFLRKRVKESFINYCMKRFIFFLESISLVVVLVIILLFSFLAEEEGVVTFLDVGQGDSILIETPNNHSILIDSGGVFSYFTEEWQKRKNPFDTGEDIVLPYLHYRGINQLDIAILTHEDLDHLGGYISLIDNIKINTFIVGSLFPRTELGIDLNNKLIDKRIRVVRVENLTTVSLDKITRLDIVNVDIHDSLKENDHNLVAFLSMYETKVLFTGDLEQTGEKKLLDNLSFSSIDILKVGHHGSSTSTSEELVQAVKPKDAVISVGKNNRYNHPSEEVIQRLENNKIKIWRTDIDGAIVVHVQPNRYNIEKTIEIH